MPDRIPIFDWEPDGGIHNEDSVVNIDDEVEDVDPMEIPMNEPIDLGLINPRMGNVISKDEESRESSDETGLSMVDNAGLEVEENKNDALGPVLVEDDVIVEEEEGSDVGAETEDIDDIGTGRHDDEGSTHSSE